MKIQNYDDVNLGLRRLAEIEVAMAKINGEVTLRCNEIKESYAPKINVFLAEKSLIENNITQFCTDRKADFAEKRSKDLVFGSIGFRVVSSVKVPRDKKKLEGLIEVIKKLGFRECIKYEEKIDRDALNNLTDNNIVKLGLKKEVKDSFRIEPNIEKLEGE